ncbi:MAG: hypothetical protein JXR25_09880 [Pontiellaceae bacterium]|nr:hypothetical protein [Pontiellaceae bacterium]MBN2785126.1 hypothetical protein [Pontiellaceae bacterium]
MKSEIKNRHSEICSSLPDGGQQRFDRIDEKLPFEDYASEVDIADLLKILVNKAVRL